MTKEHIVDHDKLLTVLQGLELAAEESIILEQLVTIGQLLQDHILEYDRSLSVVAASEAVSAQANRGQAVDRIDG